MTIDFGKQEGLFQDPLGVRLTLAREAKGLTQEQAAAQLRIPRVILEAMDREDWPRLGAPIYIRAHLSAYLAMLDLPAVLVEGPATQKAAPTLAAMDSRSRLQGLVERGMRNAVYVVMTAVIVIPVVWLATHYDTRQKLVAAISLEPDAIVDTSQADPASLPQPLAMPSASSDRDSDLRDSVTPEPQHVNADTALAANSQSPPTGAATAAPTPVVASLAPFPRRQEPAQSVPNEGGLVLTFRGDSWVEVIADDGNRLEWGLISAGERRQFPAEQKLRVTLGNADAVDVRHAGAALDLAPYRSANVARFAVSSATEILPAGR